MLATFLAGGILVRLIAGTRRLAASVGGDDLLSGGTVAPSRGNNREWDRRKRRRQASAFTWHSIATTLAASGFGVGNTFQVQFSDAKTSGCCPAYLSSRLS